MGGFDCHERPQPFQWLVASLSLTKPFAKPLKHNMSHPGLPKGTKGTHGILYPHYDKTGDLLSNIALPQKEFPGTKLKYREWRIKGSTESGE